MFRGISNVTFCFVESDIILEEEMLIRKHCLSFTHHLINHILAHSM